MEKLCIHISCDNPRAYKALESVCLEHAGTFIDCEQTWDSWCEEQQYMGDNYAVSDDKLEPNVGWVTGTPPAPCLFCGGREFHKDSCRMSPIIR